MYYERRSKNNIVYHNVKLLKKCIYICAVAEKAEERKRDPEG
jgi:hypothetical protein